jgi:hypothetical protein
MEADPLWQADWAGNDPGGKDTMTHPMIGLHCYDPKAVPRLSEEQLAMTLRNPLLGEASTKTDKSRKALGIRTKILYMAAATSIPGLSSCLWATHCAELCLVQTGQLGLPTGVDATTRKLLLAYWYPKLFLAKLESELTNFDRIAAKTGERCAVRLNGTTDLMWELILQMERWPNLRFYDYTKGLARLDRVDREVYDLTYSYDGANLQQCLNVLGSGGRVAAVFDGLPESYFGYDVVEGDSHDARFVNPTGTWVALTPKGKAKTDLSNPFVIRDWRPPVGWAAAAPKPDRAVHTAPPAKPHPR